VHYFPAYLSEPNCIGGQLEQQEQEVSTWDTALELEPIWPHLFCGMQYSVLLELYFDISHLTQENLMICHISSKE
jgi:hypothetical protein